MTTDAPTPVEEALQELWYDLVEKDDRTSPEEYPDMAMLTQDEFFAYLRMFAAARVKEAVEKEREEIEWLRRLLRWCRSRLKHESYQAWLDKYLALGPSPVPEDEPAVVQSGEAP